MLYDLLTEFLLAAANSKESGTMTLPVDRNRTVRCNVTVTGCDSSISCHVDYATDSHWVAKVQFDNQDENEVQEVVASLRKDFWLWLW